MATAAAAGAAVPAARRWPVPVARPRRADRRHLPRRARVVHRARHVVGRLQRRRHDRRRHHLGCAVDRAAAAGRADVVLGLTASLQAVLTPDLGLLADFPELLWWTFFVTHSGAVVAALVLVVGRGIVPRPGSGVARVRGDRGGRGRGGRGEPADRRQLHVAAGEAGRGVAADLMGPWPWYIGAASGAGPAAVQPARRAGSSSTARPSNRWTAAPARRASRWPARRRTRRSPPSPRRGPPRAR